MTDLHGKKEPDSLKMLVFRSLSPGQHKLYPAVPKTEAMKKAVADAKAKAEVLAEAAGLKIKGIEVISEGGVYNATNTVGNMYAKGFDVEEAEADIGGTVVQSAKLVVSASVNITFEAE